MQTLQCSIFSPIIDKLLCKAVGLGWITHLDLLCCCSQSMANNAQDHTVKLPMQHQMVCCKRLQMQWPQ